MVHNALRIQQILKRRNFGPWYPRSSKHPCSPSVVHHILADPLSTGTAFAKRQEKFGDLVFMMPSDIPAVRW